jgi:hypothetical protein
MRDKIYFCKVRYQAEQIASASSAAYWADDSRDHLEREVHDAFKKLADELGYDIEKRQENVLPALIETIPQERANV